MSDIIDESPTPPPTATATASAPTAAPVVASTTAPKIPTAVVQADNVPVKATHQTSISTAALFGSLANSTAAKPLPPVDGLSGVVYASDIESKSSTTKQSGVIPNQTSTHAETNTKPLQSTNEPRAVANEQTSPSKPSVQTTPTKSIPIGLIPLQMRAGVSKVKQHTSPTKPAKPQTATATEVTAHTAPTISATNQTNPPKPIAAQTPVSSIAGRAIEPQVQTRVSQSEFSHEGSRKKESDSFEDPREFAHFSAHPTYNQRVGPARPPQPQPQPFYPSPHQMPPGLYQPQYQPQHQQQQQQHYQHAAPYEFTQTRAPPTQSPAKAGGFGQLFGGISGPIQPMAPPPGATSAEDIERQLTAGRKQSTQPPIAHASQK